MEANHHQANHHLRLETSYILERHTFKSDEGDVNQMTWQMKVEAAEPTTQH